MTLHDTVKKWLKDSLSVEADFVLEYPADVTHGDFATNVAMVMAKNEKINPRDLAEKYVGILQNNKIDEVSGVEMAGPGFINITISSKVFSSSIEKINKAGDTFGENKHYSGSRFLIEHTQPNPFKEFHIGHMMNNVIGESVSRLIENQGNEVIRASYHGDVGLHVAKAIWGIINLGVGTNVDVKTLGQAYSLGAKMYESDELAKAEIIDINKKVYDGSDDEINNLYKTGRQVSLDYFEKMYERLGNKFNFHFYESESAPIGKKIVEEFLDKGVFEKSEGAVIFPGEKYGLHTRVFLNSDGLPTYEAKEIGLMQIKREKCYPFNLSITVTANEQDAFFKVTEKSLEQVFPDLTGKVLHLSHGMLKLPSGKMSSRTGDVLTAEWIINSLKNGAKEKIKEPLMSDEERDMVSETVALAALKFSILRQAIGGDIVFDINKALSLEGDSGPYLQYATVRASAVLRKAREVVEISSEEPSGWQTTLLEKLLERFPSVIERSANEYAPHYLVTYLTNLASEFNSFYAREKIIDTENKSSAYRLAIVKAFVSVMTSGLHLLGISVPNRM
ncbi:MAG: arginyl-tRNA synthetase [Patescibacteria group bacterium]|jgi:arginyl-tRNA synthetase|nr:arginyl-tRNA synthetase [Patescibacteria group bacterium]